MKSILIVHPQIQQMGGAEIVALQIIKRVLDTSNGHITILSLETWNLSDIFKRSGIFLPAERISIVIVRYPKILKSLSGRFYLLRMAFLHRQAKILSKEFDVCISTFNEIDFNKRGVQYVHCPTFASIKSFKKYEMINDSYFLFLVKTVVEVPYNFLIRLISGNRIEGFRRNVTMTNSQFMAAWLKELYGIPATVVFPEAASKFSSVEIIPWEKREFRFVTIGRISPDKKLLEYIDICAEIRKIYPNAKYAIIGRISNSDYYNKLLRKIEEHGLHIELYHDLENDALVNVLNTSKFYIASKKYEHYGISVLEAVRAGCLTFVHNSGGQREIVNDDILCYNSNRQLVFNVGILLENNILRNNVLNKLKHYISTFNEDNFNLGVDNSMRSWTDIFQKKIKK